MFADAEKSGESALDGADVDGRHVTGKKRCKAKSTRLCATWLEGRRCR
jgi:hypothetical protein